MKHLISIRIFVGDARLPWLRDGEVVDCRTGMGARWLQVYKVGYIYVVSPMDRHSDPTPAFIVTQALHRFPTDPTITHEFGVFDRDGRLPSAERACVWIVHPLIIGLHIPSYIHTAPSMTAEVINDIVHLLGIIIEIEAEGVQYHPQCATAIPRNR